MVVGAGLALLATLGVGAATVALGYSVFSNIRPSKGRIAKDVTAFKEKLKPLMTDLVPINTKEIGLLCSEPNITQTKKRVTTTWEGNFKSIYHENMFVFGYKQYLGKNPSALIYAKSANHEFVFTTDKKGWNIALDDRSLGNYASANEQRNYGILYLAKNNKPFAKLTEEPNSPLLKVEIDGIEVGNIYKKGAVEPPNPRAFEFVREMPKEYQFIFVSIALIELLERESSIGG